MTDSATLAALVPVIIILFLGGSTTLICRSLDLSPIIEYIGLGLGLNVSGLVRMPEAA